MIKAADWMELLGETWPAGDLEAARRKEADGGHAASWLLSRGLELDRILEALSTFFEVPSVDLARYLPQADALSLMPHEMARRFCMLPLFRSRNQVYVATADPLDTESQDFVRKSLGLSIAPVAAIRSAIEEGIDRHYQDWKHQGAPQLPSSSNNVEVDEDEHVRVMEDEHAPAIKLLNYLVSHGVRLGASDIHLEPGRDRTWLRYRIDGVMHDFSPPPLNLFRALVTRVKVVSNLDVAERRLPQDGRARMEVDGRGYDLRVSIIPNRNGEGVVMRIQQGEGIQKDLHELGMPNALRERLEDIIQCPAGIVLVTGPTGSGKTTTLYAGLHKLNTPDRKIITIEDPVEYDVPRVTQIEVNPDIDFTFSRGLRSMLRHDPDVILVGEIRDRESAEIAIRTSLTGHLVLTTLHTNDAPSAVMRLLDMGLPPFLVFSSLLCVIAQRLVRRLCKECRVPYEPEAHQIHACELKTRPADAQFFKAAGCARCNKLGYRGRIGLFELMEIPEEMRSLRADQVGPAQLRRIAEKHGFRTLAQAAREAWLQGETSFEEIVGLVRGDTVRKK